MLNERELLILSELRKNSRQSMADISRKTSIPVTTIFDKLKKLNNTVIRKHTSLLDFAKLGFNIKAAIFIKADKKRELRDFLVRHGNINTFHRIDNDYDYLVEGIFKNIGDVYNFIDEVREFGIKEMSHYYIEEDVKREGVLLGNEPGVSVTDGKMDVFSQ